MTLARNLPASYRPARAGVVPFLHGVGDREEKRFYYFLVDANYGDLTDAGGGISAAEDAVTGAVRELCEETLGVFDFRQATIQDTAVAICSPRDLILFQPVASTVPMADLCRHYRCLYNDALLLQIDNHHIENSHLVWVEEADLHRLIREERVPLPADLCGLGIRTEPYYPPLYHRLRNLLSSGTPLFGPSDPRPDPQTDSRPDPQTDSRPDPRPDPQSDPRAETNSPPFWATS
jgi:hypothetical protein